MCGRYAATKKPDQLVEEFEVEKVVAPELPADYNVAPTKRVYAVLDRLVDEAEQRQLRVVQWGLVPSWAKDPSIGNRMINARAESLGEKPAFRRAFAKRRCLLPADGYYEWYRPESASGPARKQPFFIHSADETSLALAGLYEIWRDPAVADDDDPEAFRWTVTVVTTDANADTARIHDRMPVIVGRDDWRTWLDPAASAADVQALLHPAPLGLLVAYPVSTLVNRPGNNGPELLEPLPSDAEEPEALF